MESGKRYAIGGRPAAKSPAATGGAILVRPIGAPEGRVSNPGAPRGVHGQAEGGERPGGGGRRRRRADLELAPSRPPRAGLETKSNHWRQSDYLVRRLISARVQMAAGQRASVSYQQHRPAASPVSCGDRLPAAARLTRPGARLKSGPEAIRCFGGSKAETADASHTETGLAAHHQIRVANFNDAPQPSQPMISGAGGKRSQFGQVAPGLRRQPVARPVAATVMMARPRPRTRPTAGSKTTPAVQIVQSAGRRLQVLAVCLFLIWWWCANSHVGQPAGPLAGRMPAPDTQPGLGVLAPLAPGRCPRAGPGQTNKPLTGSRARLAAPNLGQTSETAR